MATKDHILHLLKSKGPQRADDLATGLRITPMAVRQHLYALAKDGVVESSEEPQARGRPAKLWQVTRSADAFFPDSHAELTLGLIDAVRDAFGDTGVATLVEKRTANQLADYRQRCKAKSTDGRLNFLAEQRSREGYMATYWKESDSWYFAENHCPICAAAQACTGLCDGELALFQEFLGDQVSVAREEHIVTGARRCLYRVSKL